LSIKLSVEYDEERLRKTYGKWMICHIFTSATRLCDWSCLSFCLSFCEQDYRKNEPISLKLGVIIAPTNRKNWLTFGGDPVPDTDSGSLLFFRHHFGIGDFRRFISIFHAVTGQFYDTWRNDWRRQENECITFCERSAGHPDSDQSNPGPVLVDVRRLGGGLRSLSTF